MFSKHSFEYNLKQQLPYYVLGLACAVVITTYGVKSVITPELPSAKEVLRRRLTVTAESEKEAPKYCAGQVYGYPQCCIDAFNENFGDKVPKRSAITERAFQFLRAKRPPQSRANDFRDGNSYIDGFVPCEACAEKILSGAKLTSIIKRPWPLEMHSILFTKKNEKILHAFFKRLDDFGYSPDDKDDCVSGIIKGTSFTEPVCSYRCSDYTEDQWMDVSSKERELITEEYYKTYDKLCYKAKKECAEKYRERLMAGDFDEEHVLLAAELSTN